jgi:hypothetical protein
MKHSYSVKFKKPKKMRRCAALRSEIQKKNNLPSSSGSAHLHMRAMASLTAMRGAT